MLLRNISGVTSFDLQRCCDVIEFFLRGIGNFARFELPHSRFPLSSDQRDRWSIPFSTQRLTDQPPNNILSAWKSRHEGMLGTCAPETISSGWLLTAVILSMIHRFVPSFFYRPPKLVELGNYAAALERRWSILKHIHEIGILVFCMYIRQLDGVLKNFS